MFKFEEENFRGILEVLDQDGELVAILEVQIPWEAVGQSVLDGLARQTMQQYSSETEHSGKGWSGQWLSVEGTGFTHEPSN